ncbi:hypothetical protein DKX38_013592 [Salix brachista]|uniref:Uncharacterized protein n=1 Tax=Salix brachista TaxID=2182728 RepID=A0A5N5LDR1_9ROSI|nr:hypothetical protein DKX38_013592 [Salix brachista]
MPEGPEARAVKSPRAYSTRFPTMVSQGGVWSSGPWGFAGTNDGNPQITAEFVAPCYYMNNYSPTGFHHFRFLVITAAYAMLCRFEQQHAKEAQFRGVLAALAPVRAASLTL